MEEAVEGEELAVSDEEQRNTGVEELPEEHIDRLTAYEPEDLEYRAGVLETGARSPMGTGIYGLSGAAAGMLATMATDDVSLFVPLVGGGFLAGLGVQAAVAVNSGHKARKRVKAEEDLQGIHVLEEEDVECFLSGQDEVAVEIDGALDYWTGMEAAELYEEVEENLSLVTFEETSGDFGYQLNVFSGGENTVNFYGQDEEGLDYFENPRPVKYELGDLQELLD